MSSTPEQSTPAGQSTTPAKKEVPRSKDLALSIIFLSAQLWLVLVVFVNSYIWFGLTPNPDTPNGEAAEIIVQFGPGVVFIANAIVGLALMISKRRASISTLVGLIASGLVLVLGFALSAIPIS